MARAYHAERGILLTSADTAEYVDESGKPRPGYDGWVLDSRPLGLDAGIGAALDAGVHPLWLEVVDGRVQECSKATKAERVADLEAKGLRVDDALKAEALADDAAELDARVIR